MLDCESGAIGIYWKMHRPTGEIKFNRSCQSAASCACGVTFGWQLKRRLGATQEIPVLDCESGRQRHLLEDASS